MTTTDLTQLDHEMLTGPELALAVYTAIKETLPEEEVRRLAIQGLLHLGLDNARACTRRRTRPTCDTSQLRAEVSDLMQRLMAEQRLSLGTLSRRTFYNKGYLSRIKNGITPLSAKAAAALDDALNANGKFTALASTRTTPATDQ